MRTGRAGALGLVALLAWPVSALGEVVLDTAVSKVETTLEAGGRVKRELLPADDVVPGEELRYTITFTNEAGMPVDADRIVITNPIPEGTRYVSGSAGGEGSRVEYSADGETFSAVEPAGSEATAAADGAQASPGGAVSSLRWIYQRELGPGEAGEVFFHVRMQ